MVGALGAAGRTVLAHARRRHQVERTGPEPVRGAGQGADRADLHGVAGEIRFERLVGVGADLLQRTTIGQIDERIAGDLVGEPGAAGAQHAAFAIQQDLRGQRDRLLEDPFGVDEPRLRSTRRHRLILQRALAALVTHRTIERMIDEQQLHHTALGRRRGLRTVLGVHHHVVGDRGGARGDRFTLSLDVDQALPAGADGCEQRMVAEPRDLDSGLFGGPDDQRALGNLDLGSVDGEMCCRGGLAVVESGHRAPAFLPKTVDLA